MIKRFVLWRVGCLYKQMKDLCRRLAKEDSYYEDLQETCRVPSSRSLKSTYYYHTNLVDLQRLLMKTYGIKIDIISRKIVWYKVYFSKWV